ILGLEVEPLGLGPPKKYIFGYPFTDKVGKFRSDVKSVPQAAQIMKVWRGVTREGVESCGECRNMVIDVNASDRCFIHSYKLVPCLRNQAKIQYIGQWERRDDLDLELAR